MELLLLEVTLLSVGAGGVLLLLLLLLMLMLLLGLLMLMLLLGLLLLMLGLHGSKHGSIGLCIDIGYVHSRSV